METSLSCAALRSLLTAEIARRILHNLCEQHNILQPERDVKDAGDNGVSEAAHVNGIQWTIIQRLFILD